MTPDRDNIIRLAREAGLRTIGVFYVDDAAQFVGEFDPSWERFAGLVIADFLQRTGQYVTNDATRATVVAEAVVAEREALRAELQRQIQGVRYHCSDPTKQDVAVRALLDSIDAIRARSTP